MNFGLNPDFRVQLKVSLSERLRQKLKSLNVLTDTMLEYNLLVWNFCGYLAVKFVNLARTGIKKLATVKAQTYIQCESKKIPPP